MKVFIAGLVLMSFCLSRAATFSDHDVSKLAHELSQTHMWRVCDIDHEGPWHPSTVIEDNSILKISTPMAGAYYVYFPVQGVTDKLSGLPIVDHLTGEPTTAIETTGVFYLVYGQKPNRWYENQVTPQAALDLGGIRFSIIEFDQRGILGSADGRKIKLVPAQTSCEIK